MKPSSFRKVAFATACIILLSAFVHRHASPTHSIPAAQNAHYYYYIQPADTFDAFSTVGDEITRLEIRYGTVVNTSPSGGTLIAKGFINNWYPHLVWPSSLLYAH
jgi:hypothetical protein